MKFCLLLVSQGSNQDPWFGWDMWLVEVFRFIESTAPWAPVPPLSVGDVMVWLAASEFAPSVDVSFGPFCLVELSNLFHRECMNTQEAGDVRFLVALQTKVCTSRAAITLTKHEWLFLFWCGVSSSFCSAYLHRVGAERCWRAITFFFKNGTVEKKVSRSFNSLKKWQRVFHECDATKLTNQSSCVVVTFLGRCTSGHSTGLWVGYTTRFPIGCRKRLKPFFF